MWCGSSVTTLRIVSKKEKRKRAEWIQSLQVVKKIFQNIEQGKKGGKKKN